MQEAFGMKRLIFLLTPIIGGLAGLSFLISSGMEKIITNETIENVQAVFYHENRHYTLMVQTGSEIKPVSIYYIEDAKIFADVPKNEKMWAHVQGLGNKMNGITSRKIKVHIHSIENINGAGWNHGKFGSGMTVRIAP